MKKFICAFLGLTSAYASANPAENYFRREEEFNFNKPFRTTPVACEDANLVKRIVSSYQLAKKQHLGQSMWQEFFNQRHKNIHETFSSGDLAQATAILRNPVSTDLFYGIDNLCQSIFPITLTHTGLLGGAYNSIDSLIRFSEAIGANRLDNPTTYGDPNSLRKWDPNDVVASIEKKLGLSMQFPNPFADEVGIKTNKGVASYRAIQAFYQAYLIKRLLKGIDNPKVLEIGAGLGRTAFYARLLGIKDYTIIDIPMTILSSSYFLGRTLGEDKIVLLGEDLKNSKEKVKIFTPDQFLNDTDQHYDLIINVDSLTELDNKAMIEYINKIEMSTPVFLSINHESNSLTVNELCEKSKRLTDSQRNLYWMRRGYVEEIYRFQN